MRGSAAAVGIAGLLVGTVVGAAVAFVIIDRDDEFAAKPVNDHEADVIIFLDREVTDEQRTDLEQVLADDSRITSVDYFDQEESVAEFRRLFEHNQEMLDRAEANPELLPTSYRLRLTQAGKDDVGPVVDRLENQPGVQRVNVAPECDQVDHTSTTWEWARCHTG